MYNLINENEKLKNQNNELKAYYQKINQDISEANNIFMEKKNQFYQQNLEKENKLNEYREKIQLLKIKINELSNYDNPKFNTLNNSIYSQINKNSPLKYFSTTLSSRKINNLNKNKFHNNSFNYELNEDYSHIYFNNKGRRTEGRIINNDFI